MSLVAVVGDLATTTTLALAAAWPAGDRVVVIEADPDGGSMAAWLDVPVEPSLSAVVTRSPEGRWPIVDSLTCLTPSGIRIVPAPVRAVEAGHAVAATAELMRTVAALDDVVVADAGRTVLGRRSPAIDHADVTVVVHRQARESAPAAAVRLERLAEAIELLDVSRRGALGFVVVVVGSLPFDRGEIEHFVRSSVGDVRVASFPVDPLAAAVLAGHTGVSSRRLLRQPLMRASASLAGDLAERLRSVRRDGSAVT